MDTLCQRCPGVVGAHRLVNGLSGDILCTRRGTKNILGPHAPPNLAAITSLGDRQNYPNARRNVTFPAAPRKRVALSLKKPVALIACIRAGVPTDLEVVDA